MDMNEMVLAKVVHPGSIKLSSGILSGPVNRIIKMSQNDAEMLQARGVKVTILSKILKRVIPSPAELAKTRKIVSLNKEKQLEEEKLAKEAEEKRLEEEKLAKEAEEKRLEEEKLAKEAKKLADEEAIATDISDSDDEITPEYIKKCEDLNELRTYAKELGIVNKKLSKKQLKTTIIESLQKK